MKYLISKTEIYRCDSETEAKAFIEDLKEEGHCVVSSTIQMKERKQKGEVVDEWIRLTVKTVYNDEKEPENPYVTIDAINERGDNEYASFWKSK